MTVLPSPLVQREHDRFGRRLSQPYLALVSKRFPVFNLMKLKPEWTLVYEDPLNGISIPDGSAVENKIRLLKAPDLSHNGPGLCFP
jgi:hypothetical protein